MVITTLRAEIIRRQLLAEAKRAGAVVQRPKPFVALLDQRKPKGTK